MAITLQQGHQSKFWAHFLLFNFWFYLPWTLKISKKLGFVAKNGFFQLFRYYRLSLSWKNHFWAILATKHNFFDILGVAGTKIKSWIVKSVLRFLIGGLFAEIWPFSHSWNLQAFALVFTLATNKAEDWIFWLVLVGWAICKAPAQNWSQG